MPFASLLRSLLSLLRAQRPAGLLFFLLEALSTSLLQGISLLLIVPLLYTAGLLPANAAPSSIPAALQPWLAHASLERVMLLYLIVVGGYALLRFVQQHSAFALEASFIKQLRQRAVNLVCGARWEMFRRRPQAEMMQFINEETEKAGLLANQFFGFLAQLVALVIFFGMSVWVSPMLTLVLGAWGLIAAVLMRPVNLAGQRAALQLQQARRRILADIAHLLSGFKSLKVNHQEARLAERLLATSDEIASARRRFFRLNTATGTGLELGGALTIVVVIYAAITLGRIPLESLLSFVLLLSRLMPKANAVTSGWQRIGNMLATYQTLQNFLAELDRQQEPGTPHAPARYTGFKMLELRNASIGHGGQPLLNGVTLRIPANTTMLITGDSGSGKTSLLDVLAGLLAPDNGVLLVDGEAVDVRAWRNNISYMTQFPFLQNVSVRANLQWLQPRLSDAEAWAVLAQVRLADMLRTQPQGLDTPVGDNAGFLSGGERQRLALAMHLLKEARVLIFDEVTSSLDEQNRAAIFDIINRLHGRYTILVVTHDSRGLVPVDQHVHINAGKVQFKPIRQEMPVSGN